MPGSHLRRINESDTGRYQNLRGQDRLVCPAGTVVFLHHGLWHGGRRNDSDTMRYMFKIRFTRCSRGTRGRPAGWSGTTASCCALTGDENFDLDHWVTRVSNRPAEAQA